MMHYTHIICHYSEIGIKGKNRNFFEKILVDNIKNKLNGNLPGGFEYVRRISGRIIIKIKNNLPVTSYQLLVTVLKNIFGIANFSFAVRSKQDIQTLQKDCWNLVKSASWRTFRITTQRSEKNYPLTSHQVNEKVGDYIRQKSKAKVSLKKSDINCFIEIADKYAFLHLEKINGPGGMPVGTSGKALVLLSGGIDSPVAAYYALKRGIKTDFIHFHSTSPASAEKVKKLAKILDKFQINLKIFIIPFDKIQKEIMAKIPPKLRVIFYRRVMLKIAGEIAKKEKYLALITGEAVGQVASQTLENIAVIEEAVHPHTNLNNKGLSDKKTTTSEYDEIGVGVNIPVLRPLVGFDKEEIITKAKEIGTYEISILPHEDCCVRFVPKHPEIRAKLAEVKEAEKNLNVDKLVKEAMGKIKAAVIV